MKKLLVLLALLPSLTFAQYNRGLIPRNSPERTVTQKIGYTKVSASWSSPSVRGRQIWGELVPYNEMWRIGANAATTVEFSTDVTIDNKKSEQGQICDVLDSKPTCQMDFGIEYRPRAMGFIQLRQKQRCAAL